MNIINIIKEEVQDFVEGIADTYAEKEFHIADPNKQMNAVAMQGVRNEDMGEQIGNTSDGTKIYMNPKSLRDFEGEVRAISDEKGNLFVAQHDGDFVHGGLQDGINKNPEYQMGYAYDDDLYDKKILLQRVGKTNKFGLSDSYTGYALNHPIDTKRLLNAVKKQNRNYQFYPEYFAGIKLN